ncbi:MAG: hypothetical protein LPK26_17415 [Bacillaceae bacterium]|nr:hypothetical protein [Bacillaceae bacterium]
MKKLFALLLVSVFVSLLAACGNAEEPASSESVETEESEIEVANTETEEIEEPKEIIDTSMYQYTQEIEVTNAIDITGHVTLIIQMSELASGVAFQHVLNHTYEFLQQESIKDAKTIGINVILDGKKIAMFTVNTEDFVEDDNVSMAQLVLDASVVELASQEIEDYAEVFDLNLNKE